MFGQLPLAIQVGIRIRFGLPVMAGVIPMRAFSVGKKKKMKG